MEENRINKPYGKTEQTNTAMLLFSALLYDVDVKTLKRHWRINSSLSKVTIIKEYCRASTYRR